METLYVFITGVAMGLVVLLCLKLWLHFRHLQSGRLLLVVMIGVGGYIVTPLLDSWPWLMNLAIVLAMFVTVAFWLFALSLFNDWDRRNISIGPLRTTIVLVYVVASCLSQWSALGSSSLNPAISQLLFYLAFLFRFAFVLLALAAILGQWRQDLVEARRRLRSILLGLGGGYIFIVNFTESILDGNAAPLLLALGHSLLLTLLLLMITVWLLLISPDGLLASLDIEDDKNESAGSTDSSLSVKEQNWLRALQAHIETQYGYRDSELTIGSLGERLSIPEHQLRRLINQHLGYRNFSDFLSSYRITEAATRLADSGQAQLPILTIALEVGYGSLNPFNRAFKGQYKQTPSEYRRQHIAL